MLLQLRSPLRHTHSRTRTRAHTHTRTIKCCPQSRPTSRQKRNSSRWSGREHKRLNCGAEQLPNPNSLQDAAIRTWKENNKANTEARPSIMCGPLCIHAHMFSWQLMAPLLDSLCALQLIPSQVNSVSSLTTLQLCHQQTAFDQQSSVSRKEEQWSVINLIRRDLRYLLTSRKRTTQTLSPDIIYNFKYKSRL